MLIVDPPYSVHVHDNAASMGVAGAPVARDLGFEALRDPLRRKIAEAAAYVRRWSLIFTDQESTHLWREAAEVAGAEYIRTMPWIRWSQPQLSGDRPPTGAESVVVFHRQEIGAKGGRHPVKKTWTGPGGLTHFEERALRGLNKHPTQKPVDLMLQMVSYFSAPGETVLDLTCGAGSTLVAAKLLGRAALGVEEDPKWVREAQRRLRVLDERDAARAVEWCDRVEAEAGPAAAVPLTEENHNTIRRAEARLADARTVRENLKIGAYK